MSGFSHPMVRRSDRNPRAEAVGDNCPSSGQNPQPKLDMESSNTTSPVTVTESPDTDSLDKLTEQVTAASPPPVSRFLSVRMGLSADADPFPPFVASEVEPEVPAEVNAGCPRIRDYNLTPANAVVALSRSAPGKDLSNVQIPIGSPSEESETVCSSMSVSTVSVPISTDVTMPVLVQAYAPSSSPGQPSGLDPPRPMPFSSDFQSLLDMMNTVVTDVKAVRNDASLRSAEMYDMLMDVENKMVERESNYMSEVQARTTQQQEVTQALQESVWAQVTQQREEMQSLLAQQQMIIQSQMTRMQSQAENTFSQLENRLSRSYTDSFADSIRPASNTLPAAAGIESGVNYCMNDHVHDDSENSILRSVDGILHSAKMSSVAPAVELIPNAGAAAPLVDKNTYLTQPPIRSGIGSRESALIAITGTLGVVNGSCVDSSVERQQSERGPRTSVYVRCNEPRSKRPQEQEEAETWVTGKTVPHMVPSVFGGRSSAGQSVSRVNARVNERSQAFVACMEHDDDSWNCFSDNLPPHSRVVQSNEQQLTHRPMLSAPVGDILDTGNTVSTQPLHLEGPGYSAYTVDRSAGGIDDFLPCNDDDRPERTQLGGGTRSFMRSTAARIRGHSPGRSHSQPPPSQHTRELGPVPTTCSLRASEQKTETTQLLYSRLILGLCVRLALETARRLESLLMGSTLITLRGRVPL